MSTSLSLILHNIRSAENVGSIFRTADAAGVKKIYLVGYTPGPLDRFDRPRKDVAKAALGAERTVPWERVATVAPLVRRLKKEGVEIVALEQSEQSLPYIEYRPSGDVALISGNEVEGVSSSVLRLCDKVVEIPMRGKKESLNVAVATGIAVFSFLEG